MKIQIERVHLERLLANSPGGHTIGIDTDEGTINVIDKTGRVRGGVNAPMQVIDPIPFYTNQPPYSGRGSHRWPRV
jgi:hypothetical protein